MNFIELKEIVLAQFQEFFRIEAKLGEHKDEYKYSSEDPYDIDNIFLGTALPTDISLPTDIFSIHYDQALIPFERAFKAYYEDSQVFSDIFKSKIEESLAKAPDFFDMEFEELFNIPVDLKLEQTIIEKQESGVGVASLTQMLGDEHGRLLGNYFNAHVLSVGRGLFTESSLQGSEPPSPIITVLSSNMPPSNAVPIAHDFTTMTSQNSFITGSFLVSDDGGINSLTFHVTPLGSYPGTFMIDNGTGTFSFDPGNFYNYLAQGETANLVYNYYATDASGASSAPSTLTVVIEGANDSPTINGALSGSVLENNMPSIGIVTINDPDHNQSSFISIPASVNTTFGSYTFVDIGGSQWQWTYVLNNANPTVDALNVGQTLHDSFNITSADGTITPISITINGANEAYVVDNTSDVADGNYSAGQLTLREAIQLANANPSPSTISFASGITSVNTSGFNITGDITIEGGTGTSIINSMINNTTFNIHNSGNLTLDNIVINNDFPQHPTYLISLNNGSLTLNDSLINPGGSTVFINDAYLANNIPRLLGITAQNNSDITLNGSSTVSGILSDSSTINMHDSSLITYNFSINIALHSFNSILNIYDPAPNDDAIHPFVDPLWAVSQTTTINLYDTILPTTSYIFNTFGSIAYNFFTSPIIFDLNNDGVHLLSSDVSSVSLGNFTDGHNTTKMGWMGPGDGMLIYDYDQDANATHLDEFSLVSYAPGAKTDLEALGLAFDADHNQIFDELDPHFSQFGIWNDINSNGLVDKGEYSTLTDLGITGIHLLSDNQSHIDNGNIIFGYASYTKTDGSTHQLADVGLKMGTEKNGEVNPSIGIDILDGMANNGTLYGKDPGILQGGAGANVFVMSLSPDQNHNTVYNFDPRQGDVLLINDALHLLNGHNDVLSALDSLANFSHPNENSTIVTFNTGETLQINIPISSFHDHAIASQIVVEQHPLG